jgi:aspartate aminotransferase
MNTAPISQRMLGLFERLAPVYRFFTQSTYTRRAGDPTICDFVAGNPHEMPLPDFVNALQRWGVPQNKDGL